VLPPLVLLVADHQKATRPSHHDLPKSHGLLAAVHASGPNQFSYSMFVPAAAMFVLASSMEALHGQPRHSTHTQILTFCSTYHRRSNGIGLRHRLELRIGLLTAGLLAHVPGFCSLMMTPKKFSGSPLMRLSHGRRLNSAP